LKIKYIISIALIFFIVGCSPKMETPAYIWVDSIEFHVVNDNQGTASHKITDIRLTVNGTSLGLYQFPTRIPVLASGNTRLIFEAGIIDGGVAAKRRKYPFYTAYFMEVNLKKGEIDTLLPKFTYTDSTKFYFIENFESAGYIFKAHKEGGAPLEQTNDESLIFHYPKEPNNYSGIIELPYNDSIKYFEIRTTSQVELNANKISYCLMELNFCITDDIEIGIITHSANSEIKDQQIALANLIGSKNQNPEWKKAYINYTEIIREAATSQMKNFDIYIKTYTPTSGKARFLFDNIKLVYSN